jgi:hypothetical protein
MTCAKTRVRVTLTHPDGRSWTGENRCRNPQAVCPRLPGEGYDKCRTVCDQVGHAERDALQLAGEHAHGCTASLDGHTYYCMECQHALFAAGVVALRPPSDEAARQRERAYRAIADQRPEWVAETKLNNADAVSPLAADLDMWPGYSPRGWTPAAGVALGDCGNAECGWRGPLSECSNVGAVGPCCPDCREIVEPDAAGVKEGAKQSPALSHVDGGKQ